VKSRLVHAAIATEALPLTSNGLLALAAIGKVLGSQTGLEYSSTQTATRLIKAASGAVADQNFAVRIVDVALYTPFTRSSWLDDCLMSWFVERSTSRLYHVNGLFVALIVFCLLFVLLLSVHGLTLMFAGFIITACGSDGSIVSSIIAKSFLSVDTITHEPLHLA